MNIVDIIIKKRQGQRLSKEEIAFAIDGYVDGKVMDYQMSALLMAMFIRGLDKEEIYNMTDVMKNSGKVIDLSDIPGIKVDKHSSGGVGDKTTLIVGPIAAAAGVKVAKMSGRGLGFTGGTIDKLEAIDGFNTVLSEEEFHNQVSDIGIAVVGQSEDIAKADKLIYALRDVTGTVDNLGLIASSIMSKKLASGSDSIVLDVKYGSGAFMKTFEDAKALAQLMVEIGQSDGKKVRAAITSMDQPLGQNVGNLLEVLEAIEVLKGGGPEDLVELSINLAGLMIESAFEEYDFESAKAEAKKIVESGKALEKFKEMVEAQGGLWEKTFAQQDSFLGEVFVREARALAGKKVAAIDASLVGKASQLLGAGREKKGDKLDLRAGIVLNKKVGQVVSEDDLVLGRLYYSKDSGIGEDRVGEALKVFESAFTFVDEDDFVKVPQLIGGIV